VKKSILSVFAALLIAFSCISPALPKADAIDLTKNRNVYTDLDHSYDEVIRDALVNGVEDLTDDKYGLFKATYQRQYQYILFSTPELVGVKDFVREYYLKDDATRRYFAVYQENRDELVAEFRARLPEVEAEIDELIPDGVSNYDKVHIVHDYLAQTNVYAKTMLDSDTVDHYIYDASGVFVKHYAVCQGISLAFKYIMDYLGIECALAVSNNSDHAWNLVKLDGEWYHVDVTADDMWYDVLGHMHHKYLCVSTETMLKNATSRSDFIVIADDYNIVFNDATCATSKKYETDQPWANSCSSCHYYGGDLYTLGSDAGLYKNGELYFMPDEHMRWHPYGNIYANYTGDFYGAICGVGSTIYMLSPKNLYEIDLTTDKKTIIYSVAEDAKSGTQIFGLGRVEGQLYITLGVDTPKGDETWIPVDVSTNSVKTKIKLSEMTGYSDAVWTVIAEYDADGRMTSVKMQAVTATLRLDPVTTGTRKIILLNAAFSPVSTAAAG